MRDTNPHDTVFTHCFSHKQEVTDFLRGRLAKPLLDTRDLNTLKQQPNTFLPSRYRTERKVDVLWTVQTKHGKRWAFSFHFEGQSTHDKHMMGRLLEHHAAIVNRLLRAKDPKHQQTHAKCPRSSPMSCTMATKTGLAPAASPMPCLQRTNRPPTICL